MQSARMSLPLPPGQRLVPEFPRFGVARFARRKIDHKEIRIEFSGPLARAVVLTAADLAPLQRRTVTLDFHCAAGWSYEALTWSGYRFIDVWNTFVAPHVSSTEKISFAILRGRDGYRTSLPLTDVLAPDVLVADRLNEQPLSVEHGAPIRLIAPAHYGYKSAKHLASIELRRDDQGYRPLLPRLLDHPRARVALEERGQFLPGWLLRYAFRPLIQPIIDKLKRITTE